MTGKWIRNLVIVIIGCHVTITAHGEQHGQDKPSAVEKMRFIYEEPPPAFLDIVTLNDGTKHVGKIMEWADEMHVFNAAGNKKRVAVSDVKSLLFRRDQRSVARDALPDLTVRFIERLPIETSYRGLIGVDHQPKKNGQPPQRHKPGQIITLRVVIENCGNADSEPVPVNFLEDDRLIETNQIDSLAPGTSTTVEFSWPFNPNAADLAVQIDPESSKEDATRWNNRLTEPAKALSVVVRVDDALVALESQGFGLTGTYSLGDFVQYQLACFNALLSASVHDSFPNGILERVRCQRIAIAKEDTESAGEHDAVIALSLPSDDSSREAYPLRVDWRALRDLTAQLGLADPSILDTRITQSRMYDRFGRPALVRHALDEDDRGFMGSIIPTRFSRLEAAYLNKVCGKPRGPRGTYLNLIPGNIGFVVRDRDGQPLADVEVGIFQLTPTSEALPKITGAGGTSPLIEAVTDQNGALRLPNRPVSGQKTVDGISLRANAFGPIQPDYSNGLLAVRLRYGGAETFKFISLVDCQNAYLDGFVDQWTVEFDTEFVSGDSSLSPAYVVPLAKEESDRDAPVLAWPFPAGIGPKNIKEFRVYTRAGYRARRGSSWQLKSILLPGTNAFRDLIEADELIEHVEPSARDEDVAVAVAAVDKDGVLGRLSEPGLLSAATSARSLAIWSDTAFMSLDSDGPVRMLYWGAVAGTQPYMPINDVSPGYDAHFAGLAFRDASLLACDPVNHCIGVYDVSTERHTLQRTIPNHQSWPGVPGFLPGTFSAPADVAVDAAGMIFVADTGNHRVQILNGQGEPQGMVDPEFRFNKPSAISYSYGHLCVTDKDETRVRVYSIRKGEEPAFKLELPSLHHADRAIVNKGGQILVAAAQSADEDRTILSFAPEGKSAKFLEEIGRSDLGVIVRPVGLSQHGKDQYQAYFVNDFPYGVRRVQIGPTP